MVYASNDAGSDAIGPIVFQFPKRSSQNTPYTTCRVSVRPSTRLTRRGVQFYRLSEVCLAIHAAGVRSATC
jgi:hypothetical protein